MLIWNHTHQMLGTAPVLTRTADIGFEELVEDTELTGCNPCINELDDFAELLPSGD